MTYLKTILLRSRGEIGARQKLEHQPEPEQKKGKEQEQTKEKDK
jgi:hypothetical protein